MNEIAGIVSSLLRDLQLPYRWLVAIISLFLVIILVLVYENLTGTFYLGKIEKEIGLLTELQELSTKGIDKNKELSPTYTRLSNELANYGSNSNNIAWQITVPSDPYVTFWKAISGASLWIIVLISAISVELRKSNRSIKSFLTTLIGIAVIGLFFAWLGIVIPTIINPWINYFGFPIIQIAVIVLLMRKSIPTTKNEIPS